MFDQWELICFTHQWVADNLPPIYDTHGLEMSIWKEKNDPMRYLAEDHIYYEYDQKYMDSEYETYNYYLDNDNNDNNNEQNETNDTSDSEYDDDSWYY